MVKIKLIQPIDDGISEVLLIDTNERKFMVHGVFGQQLSRAVSEGESVADIKKLVKDEDGVECFHLFNTKEGAEGFWIGVNASDGWDGFATTSFSEHLEIFDYEELEQVH